MSSTPNSVRVIISGGGPVGLTAAQALTKAGIDFILLEQRPSAVLDAGSNLVLQPEGLIKLASLGLKSQIEAVSTPLGEIKRINHAGKSIGSVHWFNNMRRHLGVAPRIISRHDLTAVLYNSLPTEQQAKILPNKKLSAVTSTSSGVKITCTDGSEYHGSTIIGADGAYSKTRAQMRALALDFGIQSVNNEVPFETTFRCLWIRVPMAALSGVQPGTSAETHGNGAAIQFFAGEESAVLGLYERLPQPTKERQHLTTADEEATAARWSHLRILPDNGLTLGHIYEHRIQAGLITLEEGVVDHWTLGSKIALIGDAAHKYTPSTGSGCNNGMVDACLLVDQLSITKMTAAEIESAFQSYEAARKPVATKSCTDSGRMTAMATWTNSILSLIDVHVIPRDFVQNFLGKRIKA